MNKKATNDPGNRVVLPVRLTVSLLRDRRTIESEVLEMSDVKKRQYVCQTNPEHTALTVVTELADSPRGEISAAFESWLDSHAEANKLYTVIESRDMKLKARERLLRVTIGLN